MKKLPRSVHLKGVRYPRNTYPTKVWLNNNLLKPDKSLRLRHHSTARFSWGEDVNGASQLALAICLELYPKEVAIEVYMAFRDEYILPIKEDGFILEFDLSGFHERHLAHLMRAT
jgi:hypothetical protein